MLKTILVLPDGSELSSGTGTENAIGSITITQWVNDAQELSVGSACANMVEAEILSPAGGLNISAGDEITVYRQEDGMQRHKIGLFTAQKPTRPSANKLRLTAFDRMIRLDVDLSGWLAELTGWPYRAEEFARMVCSRCGLNLKNETLTNGEYKIQKFAADNLTGRTLVKWLGQIAGSFARITPDGELEFAWYAEKTGVSIGPRYIPGTQLAITYGDENLGLKSDDLEVGGAEYNLSVSSASIIAACAEENLRLTITPSNVQYYYFQNSLSYEDYTVAPVERVQIRQTEDDVGCAHPEGQEEVNTCRITGNYLLSSSNAAALEPVATHLYERLKSVSYTPCKVSIPANGHILAGDIVRIIDRNGKVMTLYVMRKTQTGQRDTLECTGSPTRDSTMEINNQKQDSLSGKVLNLRMDLEGLRLENREGEEKLAALSVNVSGIETQVRHQQKTMEGTAAQLTQIRQNAESVAISVKNIQDNGVSRVETATGYTFGADGLRIQKSGEEMANRLDNTGMYVTRSGECILQANNAGVVATDVRVRNYLMVGGHARLEEYPDQRTACFFV